MSLEAWWPLLHPETRDWLIANKRMIGVSMASMRR